MSRILFSWELGGGYGHIGSFLNLGRELRERGHEVMFALKDLSRAENLLGCHGFDLLQAPLWLPLPVGVPQPGNYGELLFSFGYFDEAGLTGVVRAWRRLFALIRPDLLVAENSPTALLAARGMSLPMALLGTGFSCPPTETPMPPFRWWQTGVRYRFEEHDRLLLRTMNGVMQRVGGPPLAEVADLLAADETFLCTFPEIDHYLSRSELQHYWGPSFNISEGSPPHWPRGEGKHVFAYLDPGHPEFAILMDALQRSDHSTLVHAPGAAETTRRKLETATLAFTETAARIEHVLEIADLIVSHGGHGLVAATLLAGRPMLLIPSNLEQYMLAQRVERLGAGRMWSKANGDRELRKAITDLLSKPGYASSAGAFSEAHKDFDQRHQISVIVDRMEQLASSRPASADSR